MKTLLSLNRIGAGCLGCLLLFALTARAQDSSRGGPIQGTPIGLEGDPGSVIVMANPSKEGSSVLYKGHKGTVRIVKGAATIEWEGGFVTRIVNPTESAGKGKLRFEVVGSQLRKIPLPNSGNLEVPSTIQGTEVGLEGDPGSVIIMANPPKAGSVILYKKYRGIVALLRSAPTINWDGGFVTRIVGTSQQSGETRISDQGTMGGLISYRTAPPKKGSDGILTYELVKLPDSKLPTPK